MAILHPFTNPVRDRSERETRLALKVYAVELPRNELDSIQRPRETLGESLLETAAQHRLQLETVRSRIHYHGERAAVKSFQCRMLAKFLGDNLIPHLRQGAQLLDSLAQSVFHQYRQRPAQVYGAIALLTILPCGLELLIIHVGSYGDSSPVLWSEQQ